VGGICPTRRIPQQHIADPFQLGSGGYISVFDPSSEKGWQQIAAQQRAADLAPADLIYARPGVGSRRERRFAGRSSWVNSTYPTG
jgi:hypothetical protein